MYMLYVLFQDAIDGKLTLIPQDQVFLFIPTHTARKTGMFK